MRPVVPILSMIEDIVERGSRTRRAEVLKRMTTLFVEGAPGFTEEHIQLFDEIFNCLIAKIEDRARFELSISLARIGNAPHDVIRQLATDDDIAIARPVLQHSERLEDPDLLEVAKSKSQEHLLAIANRSQLAEAITDVLVRRGDRQVVRDVAGNSGARLSLVGFSTLVRKAEKDGILAEKVGQRADIPDALLRELLVQATEVVQRRLFTTATAQTRTKIRQVLSGMANESGINGTFRGRVMPILAKAVDGISLDEAVVARFANDGRYDETIAALSKLCKIPIESMQRIMENKRADPAIVACKALGFGWQTAQAILLLQTRGHGMSIHGLESKRRNFKKMSASAARDVMRLWCSMHDLREIAG